MAFNDYFDSTYMSVSDLDGRDLNITIDRIAKEKVGKQQEVRPVLYADGMRKGMIINRTNFKSIAKILGQDDSKWKGGRVTLFPTETEFQGEPVEAIRVRPKAWEPRSSRAAIAPAAPEREREPAGPREYALADSGARPTAPVDDIDNLIPF